MSDKMIQLPLPFEEPMDNYTAVGIAEGFIASSSGEEYLRAWQHLIDTGMAYQLQGWFRRTANALIEEGHCTAPTTNTQPYSC